MKKIYLLPNMITAFGLTCGLFVIYKMNMTNVGAVTPELLVAVTWILILAAFADLIDGAVARAMKAESEFGGLFDSLSDAVTFGVTPTIVILKTLSIEPGTELSFMMTGAAMVYTVCGVLRLIRFNIADVSYDDEVIAGGKKNFIGLPIPAAAGALVSLNLFLLSNYVPWINREDYLTHSLILCFALVFLGYLMVSRWRFPSMKALRVRVASFQLVFLSVVSAVFFFYGVLHHFSLILFLSCWLYIGLSIALSLIRITTGKKSKTLADFEPEPEDFDEE